MKKTPYVVIAALVVALCAGTHVGLKARTAAPVTEFATGLNDPRGMAFGPDGYLYVAEAGSGGGTLSTVGECDQIAPPVGPYVAGHTARVVRISPAGETEVVVGGLPSSEATPAIGGDKQGASAVAFIGTQLLTLIAGAGCSHGHAADDNGIVEIVSDGVSPLVNLSA